jgi:hypothetical protein
VCFCIQHFFLLAIELDDRQQTLPLDAEQTVQSVFNGIRLDIVEITADTPELIAEFFPDLLYRFSAAFVELQESSAGSW